MPASDISFGGDQFQQLNIDCDSHRLMDQSDGNYQPAIILATRDVPLQTLQYSRFHPDAIAYFKEGARSENQTSFQTKLYRFNLCIIDGSRHSIEAQYADHTGRTQYLVPLACIDSSKDVAGKHRRL
ncbi:MAG: hypothetical protein BGO25_01020 [Acidobacteriales bacterium 59-55]|nr:MAG: hypothetical protein BGO25_01020 [Acidobacteriales bacterium 59-55]